jgi:hypothetical protein
LHLPVRRVLATVLLFTLLSGALVLLTRLVPATLLLAALALIASLVALLIVLVHEFLLSGTNLPICETSISSARSEHISAAKCLHVMKNSPEISALASSVKPSTTVNGLPGNSAPLRRLGRERQPSPLRLLHPHLRA